MELLKLKNGFRPKKGLGQHFIKNSHVVRQIIERAAFQKSDNVFEIGPGLGALTIPLAEYVHEIRAVEKDTQLVDMLKERLADRNIVNVTLINEDILKLDFNKEIKRVGEKIKVVGNLPYNISSPLLDRLLQHRDIISRAVLMFQFEFARRLLAVPDCKDYGAITVLMRYNATITPLMEVSREIFYPRPKVGSMVISIDMEKPHQRRAEDERLFRNVVKGAFAHRRKTILNSLKGSLPSYSGDEIYIALERSSIDSRRRGETLDIDEFLCLASELKRGTL